MKESVVETLKSEGSLSEKKLRKALWKVCKQQYDEEDEFDQKFESTLKSLLKKEKIVFESDEYSVKSSKSTKRKRSEDDEVPDAPADKPTKKEKAPAKVLSYDALWQTGEQLWRENGFDQEYLRTNPQKYVTLMSFDDALCAVGHLTLLLCCLLHVIHDPCIYMPALTHHFSHCVVVL